MVLALKSASGGERIRAPALEAIDRPLFCRIVFGSKDTSVTKVDWIDPSIVHAGYGKHARQGTINDDKADRNFVFCSFFSVLAR